MNGQNDAINDEISTFNSDDFVYYDDTIMFDRTLFEVTFEKGYYLLNPKNNYVKLNSSNLNNRNLQEYLYLYSKLTNLFVNVDIYDEFKKLKFPLPTDNHEMFSRIVFMRKLVN